MEKCRAHVSWFSVRHVNFPAIEATTSLDRTESIALMTTACRIVANGVLRRPVANVSSKSLVASYLPLTYLSTDKHLAKKCPSMGIDETTVDTNCNNGNSFKSICETKCKPQHFIRDAQGRTSTFSITTTCGIASDGQMNWAPKPVSCEPVTCATPWVNLMHFQRPSQV